MQTEMHVRPGRKKPKRCGFVTVETYTCNRKPLKDAAGGVRLNLHLRWVFVVSAFGTCPLSDHKMVEQALQASSAIYPQAGPSEVENHILSEINMRRATQQIGRRLAQIGDELNSRWREKLPQQRHLDWQVYPNILIWRALNRRIIGSLQWLKIMPMVRASRLVPELHIQACHATTKWINWMKPHFPEWSCKTKCFLASAVLLVAATIITATKI